jgi:transcriptional regulator with XRE-family HTH domain
MNRLPKTRYPDARTVGRAIHAACARLRISHAELAERAGIPLGTLRMYAYNRRAASWPRIEALARAVDMTVSEFLTLDAGEPEPCEDDPDAKYFDRYAVPVASYRVDRWGKRRTA